MNYKKMIATGATIACLGWTLSGGHDLYLAKQEYDALPAEARSKMKQIKCLEDRLKLNQVLLRQEGYHSLNDALGMLEENYRIKQDSFRAELEKDRLIKEPRMNEYINVREEYENSACMFAIPTAITACLLGLFGFLTYLKHDYKKNPDKY